MLMLAEKQRLDTADAGCTAKGDADEVRMLQAGGSFAPEAPRSVADTGIDFDVLSDLFLKLAHTAASFTTEWAANNLCLPMAIVNDLIEPLRRDKFIEILGDAGRLGYRLAITDRGRARATHLMEVCGYVGPAPVSIDEYSHSLEWQLARLPQVTPHAAAAAIEHLVLSEAAVEIAGLAGASGRSLFLYGPPGNGKTTLAHLLHNALKGQIWVPHCIGVGNDVIVVYDPEIHRRAATELPKDMAARVDRRWVCTERPFVVAAGELTLEALELAQSPGRYYDAPMHVKANGGTFVIDDLGRQRIEPYQLLNRWLFPLENRADYLTLKTGRKVRVPFRQMLVFSTNLNLEEALDGAFLRRIGYRLRIDNPTPADYTHVFARYAAQCQATVPPGLIEALRERYAAEHRPMRSCEPRDLIERARDICAFRGLPLDLTPEVMDLAWKGYFGEQDDLRAQRAGSLG
jgi:energy-coupling factor transporter ATP-binding protein EcfA2